MAHSELLELKQRHDEERRRLSIERQQMSNKRDGSRVLGETITSRSSVLPLYESKSQVFDIAGWNCWPKERQGQQRSLMPTGASMLSTSKASFGQPPWVVENIEVIIPSPVTSIMKGVTERSFNHLHQPNKCCKKSQIFFKILHNCSSKFR